MSDDGWIRFPGGQIKNPANQLYRMSGDWSMTQAQSNLLRLAARAIEHLQAENEELEEEIRVLRAGGEI